MQNNLLILQLFLPFSVFRLNNFCTTGSKSSLAVLVDGQVKWTKSVKREHKLITVTNTQIYKYHLQCLKGIAVFLKSLLFMQITSFNPEKYCIVETQHIYTGQRNFLNTSHNYLSLQCKQRISFWDQVSTDTRKSSTENLANTLYLTSGNPKNILTKVLTVQ